MTTHGTLGAACVALAACACAPPPNPYQMHLDREMSFLHTGVDVDAERRAVVQALSGAGLDVVAERDAEGVRALGAASPRFARTAVRVITLRGVVEAEDAKRDDLLAPGRVHLLEDAPRALSGRPLVAWVRLEEGTTAGCARLRVIDRQGRPLPLRVQPAALFGTACLGGLERRDGELWGSLAWPALTAAATPTLALPLAPVKSRLDDDGPVKALALREREGWLEAARDRCNERLAEASEFGLRHPVAVELAALALFGGESVETQRAAYTQAAGTPSAGFEQALWARAVALIERGWSEALPECGASGTEETLPCAPTSETGEDDVLQEPVHGQEAQKEGHSR